MGRIAHLWQSSYPWEVRVGKINRTLKQLGHDVVTFARQHSAAASDEEVVAVRSLPVPFNRKWVNALKDEHKKKPFSAVIVRDLPLAWAAVTFAKSARIPCIFDMAEHYPEAMRSWDKYAKGFARLAVHTLKTPDLYERWAVPKMDQIWVVCQEQADRLQREMSVNSSDLIVAHNTPESVSATQPRMQRRGKKFGYLGIWCEDRRLDVIMRAFDRACDQDSELRLELHGGGESEAKLTQLHKSLKHPDQIILQGKYSPSDYWKIMGSIDYGIVSLADTPFTRHTVANKFFDYPASGVPMIYTDLPPLHRIASTLHCGLGFEAENKEAVVRAIQKIIDLNYAQLSQSGWSGVQSNYLWSHDAARIAKGLQKLGI